MALSALPPHLRDDATVYVLNPAKGFEVARKGTNGFHTFVTRTGDDTFRGSWPSDPEDLCRRGQQRSRRDDQLSPRHDLRTERVRQPATVTAEDARHLMEHGTWRETPFPQLLHPGPHGYMIHGRGKAETEAMLEEHGPLLARLCKLKKEWCRLAIRRSRDKLPTLKA